MEALGRLTFTIPYKQALGQISAFFLALGVWPTSAGRCVKVVGNRLYMDNQIIKTGDYLQCCYGGRLADQSKVFSKNLSNRSE